MLNFEYTWAFRILTSSPTSMPLAYFNPLLASGEELSFEQKIPCGRHSGANNTGMSYAISIHRFAIQT